MAGDERVGMIGSEHPDHVGGQLLEGLRRAQPNISLAWLGSGLPFEHEADKAHYLEGFRRAGLQ